MTSINKDSSIGASPLLRGESSEAAEETSREDSHSTVHPDRLQHKRFTEHQAEKEEGSPVRILIYFAIVVALGVGAALLILNLISNNEEPDKVADDTTEVETQVSAYDINKTELVNAQAENIPTLEDLSSASLSSVGNGETSQNLTEIEYRNYESFDRISFKFETNVPSTQITLNGDQTEMTVTLPSTITVAEDLKTGVTVIQLLDKIAFNSENNAFTLIFSEGILYRARVNGSILEIDFSTEEQLASVEEVVEETTEPEETTTPEPEEEPTPPSSTNYENDFSQDKQYIVSNVTGNTVGQNNYYFYDEGSYFEFSFGAKNKVGDDYVPNSEAYLKTEGGTTYIYWTIDNLNSEALTQYGKTKVVAGDVPFSMVGANFSSIERLSFENGTAEYKITLKNNADFSLITQKSYDQTTQLISILIKD